MPIFAAMSDKHIILVGTDPTARIALDIFAAQDQVVLGILENDPEREIRELNDVGVFAALESEDARTVMQGESVEFFVTIGDNAERKAAYEKIAEIAKRPAAQAIHPAAVVSPYAKMGFGVLANAGVIVNANAVIGDQTLLHSGVIVEVSAQVGNYCNLNAGAIVGGNAVLGDNVFVGTGAIIHPGVTIGKGTMIGAGSVVLRDVEAGSVVHGNPAMPV